MFQNLWCNRRSFRGRCDAICSQIDGGMAHLCRPSAVLSANLCCLDPPRRSALNSPTHESSHGLPVAYLIVCASFALGIPHLTSSSSPLDYLPVSTEHPLHPRTAPGRWLPSQIMATPFQTEAWTEYGIGSLVLLLRFFARWKTVGLKNWQGDDFFAMLSLIFWTACHPFLRVQPWTPLTDPFHAG